MFFLNIIPMYVRRCLHRRSLRKVSQKLVSKILYVYTSL